MKITIVNYGYKFAILSILTLTIAMFSGDSSKVEDVLAQKGNTLGQEGEGNDASQSKSSSQDTNQNSMCISGDSTSLSCNNLSSESIGASVPGEQGPEGPPGPQGEAGPAGPPGATGETGPAGSQGEKGDTGATGPMGNQGQVGPPGGVGPPGPEGPQGETGATGAIGPQGPAGDQGPQGDPGVNGIDGEQGPQGETGPRGPIGPIGPQGPQGETGATGATGPQGLAGPQSLDNKIYLQIGPFNTAFNGGLAVSIASCNLGDSFVSGSVSTRGLVNYMDSFGDQSGTLERFYASAVGYQQGTVSIQAIAYCFDNP